MDLPNLLGQPGTGFHSRRLGALAFNDLIGTVGLGLLWAAIFRQPCWRAVLGMFVTGEGLHLLFGAKTAFLRMLRLV